MPRKLPDALVGVVRTAFVEIMFALLDTAGCTIKEQPNKRSE